MESQATAEVVDQASQISIDLMGDCRMVRKELDLLKKDIKLSICSPMSELKQHAEFISFSVEFFQNNEEKLKFYTGKCRHNPLIIITALHSITILIGTLVFQNGVCF